VTRAYRLTWVDTFFDYYEDIEMDADTLEEAGDAADEMDPPMEGMHLSEVNGPEGSIIHEPEYSVREVSVLLASDDCVREERLHAITLPMAVDICALMFGESAIPLAVAVGDARQCIAPEELNHLDQDLVPARWEWIYLYLN